MSKYLTLTNYFIDNFSKMCERRICYLSQYPVQFEFNSHVKIIRSSYKRIHVCTNLYRCCNKGNRSKEHLAPLSPRILHTRYSI